MLMSKAIRANAGKVEHTRNLYDGIGLGCFAKCSSSFGLVLLSDLRFACRPTSVACRHSAGTLSTAISIMIPYAFEAVTTS